MRCNLTNTGRGVRVVYGADQTAEVIINPGETKYNVDMLEAHADELTNRKDTLVVSPGTDDPNKPAPAAQQESKRPERVKLEGPSADQRAERAKKAAAHIEQVEAMEYRDWVEGAKEILGEEWPGGTLKKAAIIDLLQKAADTPR